MTQLQRQDIEYFHDGVRMVGAFRSPANDGRSRPGVLVVHGAGGLNEHVIGCAERIAALGYAVLAIDLWGDRRLLTNPADIGPMLGRFAGDRGLWMGRFEAARVALASQPGVDEARIGAVGYCFGGATVLEHVRTAGRLQGVVSFHGGLDLVADDWSSAGRGTAVLICTGAEDPMAKPADLDRVQHAMTGAGIRWEADLYSHAKHAFTEPDRPGMPPFAAYDARADRRSWNAMRSFFEEVFAG
ncbi:dienelactone hydrolase [Rhizobium sp. CF080]|uniref:dienelactone hydrolase family protein n=1 Tax=Rhizobium sp. (strain CF080) TaxID=1144310 RepID=UPI000271574D|nr:dienelactone hydrolase family protein [Rhizobium sp. CF080]EUB99189.1 dienelactone hydrolase [Rhizobium sp. CF080]